MPQLLNLCSRAQERKTKECHDGWQEAKRRRSETAGPLKTSDVAGRPHGCWLLSSCRAKAQGETPGRGHRRSQLRAPPSLRDVPAASSHHDLGPRQSLRPGGEAQARPSHKVRERRAAAQTPASHLQSRLCSHSASLRPYARSDQSLPVKIDMGNPALPPHKLP